LREVSDEARLEHRAVLVLQIVIMAEPDQPEPIRVAFTPVRGRQPEIGSVESYGVARRREARIRLISQAGLGETRELARLRLFIHDLKRGLDSRLRRRVDIRGCESFEKIAFGQCVGAESKIKRAQLVFHQGLIVVVKEKALQRTDR